MLIVAHKARGTVIAPTKKVRDVFSACLRIDVPSDAASDGHGKLVMCFVDVSNFKVRLCCLELTGF
jgi:hypothetical protein